VIRTTRSQSLARGYTSHARAVETGAWAHSTQRVNGVLRHTLANGSASFQSHPNHANHFRPNVADRVIPHTTDLRAETASFAAFKPNTFTCERGFYHVAHVKVFGKEYAVCVLFLAELIGQEGSLRMHHLDEQMGDPSVFERRLICAAAYCP